MVRKLFLAMAACIAAGCFWFSTIQTAELTIAASANAIKSEAARRLIIIDLRRLTLTLYDGDKEPLAKYPVAVGGPDSPSPAGVWRVSSKMEGWEERYGSCWLGLNCPWGSYGIHGTNKPGSIGSKVSLGCIRMLNEDVEALYPLVPIGTGVIIENDYGELPGRLATIQPGDRGNLVLATQRQLRALGYYDGGLNGIYGKRMEAAVYAFKLDHGPDTTLYVGPKTYALLGVLLFE